MTIQLKKTYQWNADWNAAISKVDINLVVRELAAIEKSNGKLTPELIIKSSKSKQSALHSYFEWSNERAANKWRIHQASHLLSNIQVVTVKDGEPKTIRAFEIVKRANGYTGEQAEFSSEGSVDLIISSSLGDLARVKNRLSGYDLTSPVKHIEKAIELLEKISTETNEK